MDTEPLVSVIVVTYNDVDHVGLLIDSLLYQNYVNYEIIVYDNASTDDTSLLIAEMYPQVRLIIGDQNLGFGGGCNIAAECARGKYLGFINSDAVVEPGWLHPLVALLESDKSIGCVGPDIACSENPGSLLCHGLTIHLSGVSYTRDRGMSISSSKPIEVGAVSGCAFLIEKEFFFTIGGFEHKLFLYYDDTDLGLRIRMLGKRCVVVPGALIFHTCDPRIEPWKIKYLERNRYLSLLSLMSVPMLLIMLPSMMALEFMSWGYCLIQSKDAVRSKYQSWKQVYQLRNWIRNRRNERMEIKVPLGYLLQAFSPHIKLNYVHSSRVIFWFSSMIGYLAAIPAFIFLRVITNRRYL